MEDQATPREVGMQEDTGVAQAIQTEPAVDAVEACPHHRGASIIARCLYGSSGKRGCDKCRIVDANNALEEAKRRLAATQYQVLNLPSEKQDVTTALNGIYGSLESVVVHTREASFATFTSKRRLDGIRQDVKAARAQADRLQEVLVSLAKTVDLQKRDATYKVILTQDLVLKELYRELGGPEWNRKDKWVSDKEISEWQGLSTKNGLIIKLEMNANNLCGTIPRSLGLMTGLEELALAKNSVSGPLPSALGDLVNLKLLYLADNQLTGSIPESFSRLTRLKVMYLSSNQLSGPIPQSLSVLKRLEVLGLARNRLTGSVPESFSRLVSLKKLDLSGNALTGAIPLAIPEMPQLEELRLSEGQVPEKDEAKLQELSPGLITIQRVVPKPPAPIPTSKVVI